MEVSELMNRYVDFIEADALISEAATLMGELDVGALPVGTAENLVGIVTDRDILYRAVARGLDCSKVRVQDVLSSPAITCSEEDDLQTVMDLMATHHVRRLPVRSPDGPISGWITLADLSRKLLIESSALQNSLRDLTETPVRAS